MRSRARRRARGRAPRDGEPRHDDPDEWHQEDGERRGAALAAVRSRRRRIPPRRPPLPVPRERGPPVACTSTTNGAENATMSTTTLDIVRTCGSSRPRRWSEAARASPRRTTTGSKISTKRTAGRHSSPLRWIDVPCCRHDERLDTGASDSATSSGSATASGPRVAADLASGPATCGSSRRWICGRRGPSATFRFSELFVRRRACTQ